MADKLNIKPFNSSLDKKKLREYFAIAQLKDGQFWGVKEGGITHREEFTEGTKPRPEQIPFLMKRSSYYVSSHVWFESHKKRKFGGIRFGMCRRIYGSNDT